MITTEEIKYELRNEDIPDAIIEKTIERMKGFLVSYTNNEKLFDDETTSVLDEILLYVVCARLSEDTRGKQGILSESVGGISFGFMSDLPVHYKKALNSYRRVKFL